MAFIGILNSLFTNPLGAQTRSTVMVTNATGALASPTNFFAANSNLIKAAIGGGGSATNASLVNGVAGAVTITGPGLVTNGPGNYSVTNSGGGGSATNGIQMLNGKGTNTALIHPSLISWTVGDGWFVIGDSLSANFQSNGFANSWFQQLTNYPQYSNGPAALNCAYGGSDCTAASNAVKNCVIPAKAAGSNLCFAWIGANDYPYTTLNVFTNTVYSAWTNLQSNGFLVAAFTVIPRTHLADGQETNRLQYNQWIRTCGTPDYVIDVAARFTDTNGPDFQADHVHLTVASWTVVAGMVQDALLVGPQKHFAAPASAFIGTNYYLVGPNGQVMAIFNPNGNFTLGAGNVLGDYLGNMTFGNGGVGITQQTNLTLYQGQLSTVSFDCAGGNIHFDYLGNAVFGNGGVQVEQLTNLVTTGNITSPGLTAALGLVATNSTNFLASTSNALYSLIGTGGFSGTPLTNWIGILSTNSTNFIVATSNALYSLIGTGGFSGLALTNWIGVLSTNGSNNVLAVQAAITAAYGVLSTNSTNYAEAGAAAAIAAAGVLSTNGSNYSYGLFNLGITASQVLAWTVATNATNNILAVSNLVTALQAALAYNPGQFDTNSSAQVQLKAGAKSTNFAMFNATNANKLYGLQNQQLIFAFSAFGLNDADLNGVSSSATGVPATDAISLTDANGDILLMQGGLFSLNSPSTFAGHVLVSSTVVSSNFLVLTNVQVLGVDMNRGEGDYTASASITLTDPINCGPTNYNTAILNVTNTQATNVLINCPSYWHTNSTTGGFNVTNGGLTKVWVEAVAGKWTNAIISPLW